MKKLFVLFAVCTIAAFVGHAQAAPMQAQLTDTSQIRTMSNNPFFGTQKDLAGVNFYYATGGGTVAGTVNGVGFDNIDLTGVAPPPGPYALTANGTGPVLTLNMPFTSDNAQRNQSLNATGADDTNLEALANEFFYLTAGNLNHPTASLNFTNLGVAEGDALYVQIIGGDTTGWNGDIDVIANGVDVGLNWTDVADGVPTTAELFSFDTTAGPGGSLAIQLNGIGQFAGVSGIIVSAAVPEPSSIALWTLLGLASLLGLGWKRLRGQSANARP